MTAEIAMRRVGNKLEAVDPVSEEMLQAIPTNKDLLVVVKTPRNVRQFKLAWALAHKLAEACDFLHDSEDAMDFLKVKAKHFRAVHDPLREVTHIFPKSINWASLSQEGFNTIFKRMIYIVTAEILPGLPDTDLKREIEAMVAPGFDAPADQPEPPPHDTVPDGPVAAPATEASETAPSRSQSRSQSRPRARRAFADDEAPPQPEARPEPRQPAPEASSPDRAGILQTVEMAGEPDWRIDTPGDAGSYAAYCRFHVDQHRDFASCLVWFNSEENWNLRQACKVGIESRKQLENYLTSKFKGG